MIQANELRIGNLLKVGDNFWTVESIITNPFELYFYENQEYDHSLNGAPIPLTEEWLLRFGFEKDFEGDYMSFHNGRVYYFRMSGFLLKDFGVKTKLNQFRIHYVHQLQNLYFALTGEELKQKEVSND